MDRAGTRWAGDEIARLIQSVREHGMRWRKFVHLFNGRSTGSLKKKYRQLQDDGLIPEVAAGPNQNGVRGFDLNQHPDEEGQLLDQKAVYPAPAPEQNEVNPAAALPMGLLNAAPGEGEEAQAGENLKQALMWAITEVVREETMNVKGCINEAIEEGIKRQLESGKIRMSSG